MSEAAPFATPARASTPWLQAALQDRRTALGIAVAGLLVQMVGHQNGDNSWFITFAEHVRDGATPYVDISDPNLPLAFLIYMPAVLLGRLFGLAPEFVLVPLVFVGAAVSALLAGSILRRGECLATHEEGPTLCAAAFVLMLMPAFCFAEREHVALIAMLPLFAVLVVRAAGGEVALAAALLAGAGGGLALGIKPHYALALALPWAFVLWRGRSVSVLFRPEVWALFALVAANVALVLAVFPTFVTKGLPLILDVYARARAPLAQLVVSPLFLANAVVLVALALVLRHRREDRAAVGALASLGFLLTFLIQGKGWINHAYPGLALAVLALVPVLLLVPQPRRLTLYVALPFIAVAPFLCGLLEDVWSAEEYPGLTAAVLRVAPPHPTIMGLAQELDVVHPLVRHVDGRFAGRQNCLWVSMDVDYMLGQGVSEARRETLLRLRAADETMFAEDVRRARPDVILSESPALVARSRRQAPLAHVLDGYRSVETVGDIEIWLRRP